MSTITTPNLSLPLPDPTNTFPEDLIRIATALGMVDTTINTSKRPGVYNYQHSAVQQAVSKIGGFRSGGSLTIACVGDSTTMGYNSNAVGYANGRVGSYPKFLEKILTANGLTAHSDNFFGSAGVSMPSAYTEYDPRVTLGESVIYDTGSSLGGYYFTVQAGGGALTFTPGSTFNRVDVYVGCYGAGGSIDVNVGDATVQTIVTNDGSEQVKKFTINVANGSTVVNLLPASGNSVIIGVNVWTNDTNKVHVLNMGFSGSTSDTWSRTTYWTDPHQALPAVAPDIVLVNLGINDWTNGVSLATYKDNMAALITGAKAYATVIGVVPIPTKETVRALSIQKLFRQALFELSITTNTPFVDLMERRGSQEVADSYGLYSDTTHGSAAGNADVAMVLADLILRP